MPSITDVEDGGERIHRLIIHNACISKYCKGSILTEASSGSLFALRPAKENLTDWNVLKDGGPCLISGPGKAQGDEDG